MTIEQEITKITLNGDGANTSWDFNFKIWEQSEVRLVVTDASGNDTEITDTGTYSVTILADPGIGGTVVYPLTGTPVASGEKLTILTDMIFKQVNDYVTGEGFAPEVVETGEDQRTRMLQQLKERLERAVVAGVTESGTDIQELIDAINKAILVVETTVTRINPTFPIIALQTDYTLIYPVDVSGDSAIVTANGITQDRTTDFSFPNRTTIRFTTLPPVGTDIIVRTSLLSSDPTELDINAIRLAIQAEDAVFLKNLSVALVSTLNDLIVTGSSTIPTITGPTSITGNVSVTGDMDLQTTKMERIFIDSIITNLTAGSSISPATVSREYVLGITTSADSVLAFDALTSDHDGMLFFFRNESYYKMTIQPPTGVRIWKSGIGYGIETPNQGWITLRYDHSDLILRPIAYEGSWRVEGIVHYMKMVKQATYDGVTALARTDETVDLNVFKTHGGGTYGTKSGYKYIAASVYYTENEGTDLTNYNVVNDKTTDFTVAGWLTPDAASLSGIVSYWLDGSNYWWVYRGAAGTIHYDTLIAGISDVNIVGGSTSIGTSYYVTLVKYNGDIGIYLGGVQIAFVASASWNTNTMTAARYNLGRFGGNSAYLNGTLKDWFLCHQNIFNAAPNVSLTDTINVPQSIANEIGINTE